MKIKIRIMLFILFYTTFIINAQSNISIYVNGGPNYSPMRGVEHDLISWQKTKIDRINFSANIGTKYSINDYSNIYLNFEYNPIELSYGGWGAEVQYNLKIIPMSIGYEYIVAKGESFSSYLGFGFGLAFLSSEYKYYSDIPNEPLYKENDSGFLLAVKYGIEEKINNSFFLSGELGYRYAESLVRNMYSTHNDVNISGLFLKIGIGIRLEL